MEKMGSVRIVLVNKNQKQLLVDYFFACSHRSRKKEARHLPHQGLFECLVESRTLTSISLV